MKIKDHIVLDKKYAEVLSDQTIINNPEDGLDLMGNLYHQGYDGMILYNNNITPDFYDLKNGMAGELLQKFSNYKFGLVLIGDFSQIKSQSLKDFIFESNKGRHINFQESIEAAIEKIARK